MVRAGALSDYAIGGAIGAVFYIEPFATQDVDVFVMMQTESSGLVATIPGWSYLRIRGEAPVSNALEEEAYLNATTLDFEGEPVRVVLAEHLVALMLRVGRLKDLSRVLMFLSQEAVDQDILLDIIRRHGLEKQWADFQTHNLQ